MLFSSSYHHMHLIHIQHLWWFCAHLIFWASQAHILEGLKSYNLQSFFFVIWRDQIQSGIRSCCISFCNENYSTSLNWKFEDMHKTLVLTRFKSIFLNALRSRVFKWYTTISTGLPETSCVFCTYTFIQVCEFITFIIYVYICYVYCRFIISIHCIENVWILIICEYAYIYIEWNISRKGQCMILSKASVLKQVFSGPVVSRGKKSRRLITWCLAVVVPCCRSWIVIPSNVRNLRVETSSGKGYLKKHPQDAHQDACPIPNKWGTMNFPRDP